MADVKTYPFDLARALAGDAVCTIGGSPVYVVAESKHITDGQTLLGVHSGDYASWYPDGVFMRDRNTSCLDLRMVTDGGPTIQDELVAALKAVERYFSDAECPAELDDQVVSALARAGAL